MLDAQQGSRFHKAAPRRLATHSPPTYLRRMSRSPAADLAPSSSCCKRVCPVRAAAELSRVLAIWTAELKDDDEQLQERLSGLAEQLTMGIEEMHEGIAEASDKGKPTLRRILATHEAVLDGLRKAQGAG
ncbi:hypothetical protein ACFQU7_37080 [Pseudoroseomonas wenyumeiae]